MPSNDTILTYQQKCYREYAQSIGLPQPYTYPDGNPIRPLPPLQVATGGLMIVGAYPSARFESRPSRDRPNRYRLVPVADNLQPFGYEQYFDGTRVRTLESADGLRKYLLNGLALAPEECWITDLVKVFLYKPEHTDSCTDAHPGFAVPELRSEFKALARRSLGWLQEECRLCRPRLTVTLGQEVAQVISGRWNAAADQLLLGDVIECATLGGYRALFLPHPDACRRSEKWRGKMADGVTVAEELLRGT
jgi:uracil-DNA glycosylase